MQDTYSVVWRTAANEQGSGTLLPLYAYSGTVHFWFIPPGSPVAVLTIVSHR
jgi:hypothetical protein